MYIFELFGNIFYQVIRYEKVNLITIIIYIQIIYFNLYDCQVHDMPPYICELIW